jgi:GT2 family glycosyltransferase
MFVRRAVFARTGGLSEDYFLYCEELDLARQLLPGEAQGWAPDAVVFHKEGGSIGTSSISRPSDTSLYYLQVNTLRFYRKFHAWLLPLGFLRIAREAFTAFRKRDHAALRVAQLAVVDFITGVKRTGAITPTTGRL